MFSTEVCPALCFCILMVTPDTLKSVLLRLSIFFAPAFALGYLLQIIHSPSSALQADRARAQWETKVVPLMDGVGFEAMVVRSLASLVHPHRPSDPQLSS